MTSGHTHRHVTIEPGGRLYRLLKAPLFALGMEHTTYVEKSRLVWGMRYNKDDGMPEFYLSSLGLLHGLFGLTLAWPDDRYPHDPKCRTQYGLDNGRFCCLTWGIASTHDWTDGT